MSILPHSSAVRALPARTPSESAEKWVAVLNYATFARCNSLEDLANAYRVKNITFASESDLIAQIQADWSKVQVGVAQYYIDLGQRILEPTIVEEGGRSRAIFGLRHCIDPEAPDFTEKLEDHIINLSSAPVYVEHNIGQSLNLTLPYTECPDWIVMTTSERFCYGVAMASCALAGTNKFLKSPEYTSEVASTVFDLSKIALEHLYEPSALRGIRCSGENVSLLEKLSQHQGVFSPLLFGSSPLGVLPEYVDLELKLKYGIELSLNERRSLFASVFLRELPLVHVNGIFGAAHSAQVSYFERNPSTIKGYDIVHTLATKCAQLSIENPAKFQRLCDEQRVQTLRMVEAGQALIERIERGVFNNEVDGQILRTVENEINGKKDSCDLQRRLERYFG